MLKTALVMLMMAGTAAQGQAQSDAAASNKADKASAYYHYVLARMYAEKAATEGQNRESVNKAIENYNAAIKAAPQTVILREELSKIEGGRLRPRPPILVFRPHPR